MNVLGDKQFIDFAPLALLLFWLVRVRIPGTHALKPAPSLPAER